MRVLSFPLVSVCIATFFGVLGACGKGHTGAASGAQADSTPTAGVSRPMTAGTGGQMAVEEAAGNTGQLSMPPACNGSLPAMKIRDAALGVDVDPDWSCYDDPSIPTPSVARSLVFHVDTVPPMHRDVLPSSWFQNVQVDFFFEDSTLGMPAVFRAFDGTRNSVMFDIPEGITLLSAHLHGVVSDTPSLSIPELREYNFSIPGADMTVEGSIAISDMIALAVKSVQGNADPPDPTKAILLAYARDCQGRDVSGALIQLLDGATNAPVMEGMGRGLPRSAYFYFALPNATCTFTDNDQALWIMTQAPVNVTGDQKTHSYRLRLSGRMRQSDTQPVVLGEQEVELFANTTSMVRLFRETPR